MSSEVNYGENVVDIDKWVSSLTRILEDVPLSMCNPGHPGRISRIPQNLREVDVKSYEPYFLSLGPFHHGKQKLQNMEKRKKLVLRCVLENTPELTLQDYVKEIKSIESVARSFYSDIDMESDEFVQMLLLDSVYLITMFCGMPKGQESLHHACITSGSLLDTEKANEGEKQTDEGTRNNDDDKNTEMIVINGEISREGNDNPSRWFWSMFVHDLFLLENQLPFFVLQKIYYLSYGCSKRKLVDILNCWFTIATLLFLFLRGLALPSRRG